MNLNHLALFQVVCAERSFTAAARRLSLDKSRVSRVVRELERALGAPLFTRTTRTMRLTPDGEALLARVAEPLAALERAAAQVPARAASPEGEVAITTTHELGRALLAPALPALRLRYPRVKLILRLGAELMDLTKERVDLALRVGRPGGQAFVARKLGELQAGFFAAPAYLERRGIPARLEDLAGHEGLWPPPARERRSFAPSRPQPPAAVECGDFGLLAELARAGGGVALLPTFLVARDVAQGALVPVLPEHRLGGAPLYLVSRPERPQPARVAAVRSALIEQLRARLGQA